MCIFIKLLSLRPSCACFLPLFLVIQRQKDKILCYQSAGMCWCPHWVQPERGRREAVEERASCDLKVAQVSSPNKSPGYNFWFVIPSYGQGLQLLLPAAVFLLSVILQGSSNVYTLVWLLKKAQRLVRCVVLGRNFFFFLCNWEGIDVHVWVFPCGSGA